MVKSMDAEKHEIWEHLDYIASQRRMLKLTTSFRGVSIDLAAGIIRCSHSMGALRLHVHNHQMVSIKTADKILLQSDLFPSMLVGEIDDIDLHTSIVTLGKLRYVTGSMGNRKNVRVQPENPIRVEVISGHGYSLLGEMIDISLKGLSIQIEKESIPHEEIFNVHALVEIHLGLPMIISPSQPVSEKDDIHDISVQAKIAYIKNGQQTYRIGLLTFLNEPNLGILRRYIFDRQTEILQEIRQMNSPLLEAA
jgi:hypothetical protein